VILEDNGRALHLKELCPFLRFLGILFAVRTNSSHPSSYLLHCYLILRIQRAERKVEFPPFSLRSYEGK